MLIYKHGLLVGTVLLLLLGSCYGQVAPLYPAQSDLTSGSLVAAGSIGIVALAASAGIAVKAELKNFECEKKKEILKQEKEEVENKLKAVEEELQLIKVELSEDTVSCKTPWYTVHPVLGCIRLYKLNPTLFSLTTEQWVDKCAEDGAKLILINSAAENQALVDLMAENSVSRLVIQGRRETAASPWLTEDGQLLPYTGEFEGPTNTAGTLRLAFTFEGKWRSEFPSTFYCEAVCET